MPQAPAMLDTSCFVSTLSLHFDVIRVALRTEDCARADLERAGESNHSKNPIQPLRHG